MLASIRYGRSSSSSPKTLSDAIAVDAEADLLAPACCAAEGATHDMYIVSVHCLILQGLLVCCIR